MHDDARAGLEIDEAVAVAKLLEAQPHEQMIAVEDSPTQRWALRLFGRALIRARLRDPECVEDLRHGRVERSACNPCNVCAAEMDRNGVRCALTDAAC